MKGLLFITHSTDKFTTIESAKMALEGGCRRIQLRMKTCAEPEILRTAHELKDICRDYKAELYIDDYPEICRAVKATGVHLGKNDMPIPEARSILGDSYIIGGTANSFEDICRLNTAGADYIGLGPFRFTTTKNNLSPLLGLEGYQRIIHECRVNNIDLPVVAIGGITRGDIGPLFQAGIDAIALSSAILTATSPVEETAGIIQIIQTYTP